MWFALLGLDFLSEMLSLGGSIHDFNLVNVNAQAAHNKVFTACREGSRGMILQQSASRLKWVCRYAAYHQGEGVR
jgi:hypothetical protein